MDSRQQTADHLLAVLCGSSHEAGADARQALEKGPTEAKICKKSGLDNSCGYFDNI
jgi:hypothetical protein